MKTYQKKALFTIGSILLFFGCAQKEKNAEDEILDKKQYSIQKKEVNVELLKNKPFEKELVSNGKLIAIKKNILKFDVSAKLQDLNIKNGSLVHNGQILAVLDGYKFKEKVNRASINLKEAKLDFRDMLITRGFNNLHKDSIPPKIYEMVSIRSGYESALKDLKDAEHELSLTQLVAPFKGRIANIKYKQHENITSGSEFITLIDDSFFEVEFYLIESEIGTVVVKDKVVILPFALSKKYKGEITSINPMVEKNGTILVKASIKNDGKLIEGMNVKVLIKKDIPNQFVVPKSAVILRQNQEVLFKLKNGKAYWTYVLTTHENSRNYTVIPHPNKNSANLNPGDSIIISDNLNLAHDSEVVVKRKRKKKKK